MFTPFSFGIEGSIGCQSGVNRVLMVGGAASSVKAPGSVALLRLEVVLLQYPSALKVLYRRLLSLVVSSAYRSCYNCYFGIRTPKTREQVQRTRRGGEQKRGRRRGKGSRRRSGCCSSGILMLSMLLAHY